MSEKRKIRATIIIHTNSKVAHLREAELQDWLKRHTKDIESVVCSSFDEMEEPQVKIEEDA